MLALTFKPLLQGLLEPTTRYRSAARDNGIMWIATITGIARIAGTSLRNGNCGWARTAGAGDCCFAPAAILERNEMTH